MDVLTATLSFLDMRKKNDSSLKIGPFSVATFCQSTICYFSSTIESLNSPDIYGHDNILVYFSRLISLLAKVNMRAN